jgi:predicted RNase H-like HicB family nuclease
MCYKQSPSSETQGRESLYLNTNDILTMFAEYIQAAMDKATYEIIDDREPFYGEVPELQGVWATGKTLEECRKELQSVIEGWIALKLRLGHPIPPIGGHVINVSAEPVSIVE